MRRHLVQGKDVHMTTDLRNLPVGLKRDIFRKVRAENYSTDDRHNAQLFFSMTKVTNNKNLDSEKFRMAELCSVESLTYSRISMCRAYQFVSSVGDHTKGGAYSTSMSCLG